MVLSLCGAASTATAGEEAERPDSNEDVGDAAETDAAAASVGADMLICFEVGLLCGKVI